MRMMQHGLLVALALLTSGGFVGTGEAFVLCGRADRTGELQEGAVLRSRTACRANEVQVDPAALGLQGPAGPPGEKGEQGEQGEQGPPGPGPADLSARIYNSGPVHVPSGIDTVLEFDSERFDTAAMHDSQNPSRLTAPVAGKYLISAHVSFPTNGAGARGIALIRNGVEQIAADHGAAEASYYTELSVATQYELAAGDYIELRVAQDSGSTIAVVGYPTLQSPELAMARRP